MGRTFDADGNNSRPRRKGQVQEGMAVFASFPVTPFKSRITSRLGQRQATAAKSPAALIRTLTGLTPTGRRRICATNRPDTPATPPRPILHRQPTRACRRDDRHVRYLAADPSFSDDPQIARVEEEESAALAVGYDQLFAIVQQAQCDRPASAHRRRLVCRAGLAGLEKPPRKKQQACSQDTKSRRRVALLFTHTDHKMTPAYRTRLHDGMK